MTRPIDALDRSHDVASPHPREAEPDAAFDALARSVCLQLDCPMAFIGLLDGERLNLKAQIGLDLAELPLPHTLLSRTLAAPEGLLVESGEANALIDALQTPGGPALFFAGARIEVDGVPVGIVAALDHHAKPLSHRARQALADAACIAAGLLAVPRKPGRDHRPEARAREAEQRLSDALDSMSAAVMISDAGGNIVMANAVWRHHVAGEQIEGMTWPQVIQHMAENGRYPDAMNPQTFMAWRLGLASPLGEQHEMRWKDRWAIISDRLLADGSVVHLSIDITDRKRAELALAEQQARLHESQAQLKAVLGAIPDLWFVLDAEGRYLECSDEHHPLLLKPWASVHGQPFAVGVPQALADRVMVAQAQALATQQIQRLDYEVRTPDGTPRTFEARISPMPGARVLYVTRDLTELRNLERDVLVMQRVLEADTSLSISVTDATQPDMPLVYVSPTFERLTGYPRAEVIGRNCRFLQGHLATQDGVATLRAAIQQGQACSVTLKNVRKNGEVFSNTVQLTPVRDATGLLTHYVGVQHDVTEQNLAADKLRLSEELYRSVALAISDGLLVVTPELGIIAANPASCAILGAPQEALVGIAGPWPFELLDADAQALHAEQHPVKRAMGSDKPLVQQVYALRRPDAGLRWIELSAHALQLNAAGGAFAVVLTFRDITRQRAAEQALLIAEERWKFAVEGSGDGVWDWDVNGDDAIFLSPHWKAMLGYADDEFPSSITAWKTRVHPDDREAVLALLRQHLRGETAVYESEHRMRHRQGHDLWVRDRGKVVSYGSDGRAQRFVGTQSDITRNRQADQMLRDKQAAELASQAKSEFLSRMSHEMRTPLNAVIGFSQLLNMNPESADVATVRNYSGHVLDAGEHLLALIDDVLDLQKIEEGALTLTLGPVDLRSVVLGTMELLAPMAQARQVAFDNQLHDAVWVHADMQRLRQVLLNVASNAIKYNRDSGKVRWHAAHSGTGRITLSVEDDGAGMSEEQLKRLFQPFERLGRETSAIEGTGLGLIISRSLIEAIGGQLRVTSKLGQGTCIRIELQSDHTPMTEPTLHSAPTASSVSPASPPVVETAAAPAALRLLYVEDNRINALLFEQAMRLQGGRIEVRVAEDGDAALQVAQSWRPEVLVLDAHLPGITGFDVLTQLRALPGLAEVPAYMCSADAMPDDVQRARDAGFIGYWTKPIKVSAILADLQQWLPGTGR